MLRSRRVSELRALTRRRRSLHFSNAKVRAAPRRYVNTATPAVALGAPNFSLLMAADQIVDRWTPHPSCHRLTLVAQTFQGTLLRMPHSSQWWSISRYVVHSVTYAYNTRNEKAGMGYALKMLSPQGGFFKCKQPRSRRNHVRFLGGRASRARRAPTRRTLLAAALCR